MTSLARRFNLASFVNAAFWLERQAFDLKKAFLTAAHRIPNWAIDKDYMVDRLKDFLSRGYITPMDAVALLSATSIKHRNSQYDPAEWLTKFLALYNAKTWQEAASIEEFGERDPRREILRLAHVYASGNQTEKMKAVRIRAWAMDLEDATRPTFLDKKLGKHTKHKSVRAAEIDALVARYNPSAKDDAKQANGKIEALLPKTVYLPLLRKLRQDRHISETQCGVILCFLMHTREKRKDDTPYVTHPMAVANLVQKYGRRMGLDTEQLWKASLVALLHDLGEHSDFDVEKDLEGLLPKDVIEAVKCLHVKTGQSYIHDIEQCARNPLAAIVKLCDNYHNSSDMNPTQPSFRQEYVYPVTANYLKFCVENPERDITMEQFVAEQDICTADVFALLKEEVDRKPKRKFADPELRGRLGQFKNLTLVNDIFPDEIPDADPRGDPNFSL